MSAQNTPPHNHLMNPIIAALKKLGGSGTIEGINTLASEIANLSDEQLEILHKPEKGGERTEVEYRMTWARIYLKRFSVLENSSRGVWALTAKGSSIEKVKPNEVNRFMREHQKMRQVESDVVPLNNEANELLSESEPTQLWREELLDGLLRLHPSAVERLVQRLLRESGFTQVEVTGQSGDGGVDCKGIVRLGSFLSLHVIFQCKRYRGRYPRIRFEIFVVQCSNVLIKA